MKMIWKAAVTLAVSFSALVAAASINLAVLYDAPSGPDNVALGAIGATTTTAGIRKPILAPPPPTTTSTTQSVGTPPRLRTQSIAVVNPTTTSTAPDGPAR